MGLWDYVTELFRLAIFTLLQELSERFRPKHSPQAELLEWTEEYPRKYSRDYFNTDLPEYGLQPMYDKPLDHLYDNDFLGYQGRKYRAPINNYKSSP